MEDKTITEKKLNGYRFKEEDFIAENEITVTITLHEYRDLVEKCATREADIKEAKDELYDKRKEVETLQETVENLKAKIVSLVSDEEEENE